MAHETNVVDTTISGTGVPPGESAGAVIAGERTPRRQTVVAVIFTAALLFATLLSYATSFDEVKRMDFATRYAAGLMVREGHGAQLYDLEAQTRIQRDLFGRATPLLELHPPFEALLYSPLSKLPLVRAYLVWGVFNIMLWIVAAWILRASVPAPRQNFQFLIVCFTFFPLWLALHGGQTSILLLLSYALALFNLKKRRDFATGVSLGIGLCKFQLVVPFALICALRGKGRLVAGFVAVAGALAAVSMAVAGQGGLTRYASLLLYTTRHPADPSYSPVVLATMPTLRGFFTEALRRALPASWISVLVALLSAALVLYAAWRWHREDCKPDGGAQGLMFAAALATSLLSGYYMFANDLSALLPAMLLALGVAPWSWRSKWHVALAASALVLYLPFVYLLLSDRLFVLCPVLLLFALALFFLTPQSGRASSWSSR